MATAVDYDPFAQQTSSKGSIPVDYDPFAKTTPAAPAKETFGAAKRREEKEGSEQARSAVYGGVTGLLAFPGETEKLVGVTLPKYLGASPQGKFLGRETIFPTTEEVEKVFSRLGIEPPAEKYSVAKTVGEFAPAIAGGASLLKKGGEYVAKKAAPFLEKLANKESKELTKALKTDINAPVTEKIAATEKGLTEAQKKAEAAAKAQQEIGGRGRVAEKRQATREKEVESSLDTLSKDKNVLAEDVGSVIQPEGKANIEKLRSTRTREAITEVKDPAFESARNREGSGDFLSTNPKSQKEFNETIKEIETQIERTPEPYRSELRKRLSSLRGEEVPLSAAELKTQEVRSAYLGEPMVTTKVKPMTLDQAEFMRRILKDKSLGEAIGAKGMDVSRMNELGDKLLSSMNAYEPRIAEYISKYKSGSEPITRALSGRGQAMTEMEIVAEENALFSADKKAAADYYLNGTQERAQRLLDLIGGKKAQVVDKIKGYFRTQMEGMNAKQAQDFVSKQEGFLRVFPELRDSMNKIVQSKGVAETAGKEATKQAGEAATRVSGRATTAQTQIDKLSRAKSDYEAIGAELETASIDKLQTFAKKLYGDKLIDLPTYEKMVQRIQMAKDAYGDTQKARRMAYYAMGGLGATVLGKQTLKYTGVLGE